MNINGASSVQAGQVGAWRGQVQQNAFRRMDSDGSGGVNLAEFSAALQSLPATGGSAPAKAAAEATGATTARNLEAGFKALDRDGDGQLTQAELSAALRGRRGQHGLPGATPGAPMGLGTALAAQLLGQRQALPGSGGAAASGTMNDQASGAADQVRDALRRYAFAAMPAPAGAMTASA